MPIRKKRHDKTPQATQGADSERYIASVITVTTACYADQSNRGWACGQRVG